MTCSGLPDKFELLDKVVDELVDEVEVPDKLDKGERDCAMSLQACCLFSPSWKWTLTMDMMTLTLWQWNDNNMTKIWQWYETNMMTISWTEAWFIPLLRHFCHRQYVQRFRETLSTWLISSSFGHLIIIQIHLVNLIYTKSSHQRIIIWSPKCGHFIMSHHQVSS